MSGAAPEAGMALRPFRIEHVSAEAMKVWAAALHDPNPIHLDPAVCAAKGLGNRVINQGPANLAYVMNMLAAALPGCTLAAMDVRYLDNVFAGEAVEAGGRVTGVSPAAITCEVFLNTVEGRPVIAGTATLHPLTA